MNRGLLKLPPADGAGQAEDMTITTATFLTDLLRGLPHKGAIELRHLDGANKFKGRTWASWPTRTGQVVLPDLPALRQTYYGVALRMGTDGTVGVGGAANCYSTNQLYLDLDLKHAERYGAPGKAVLTMAPDDVRHQTLAMAHDALARLREMGIEPWAIVYTGHGVQILMRLPDVVPHAQTVLYNRALSTALGTEFGADISVSDPARVLRCPGTRNLKNLHRPLNVEVWGYAPEAQVDLSALEALTARPQASRPPTQQSGRARPIKGRKALETIQAFNTRFTVREILESLQYKKHAAHRYTRPGDDASGGDVELRLNKWGLECSYHYSSNDPIRGTPGDGHLRNAFDLFRDGHHRGDTKGALRAAEKMLTDEGTDETVAHPLPEENEAKSSRESKGMRLLDYLKEAGAEPWRDSTDNRYLTVKVGGHARHLPLPSEQAREYCYRLFRSHEPRDYISTQMANEILLQLRAEAGFSEARHTVGLRVGRHEDTVYIDLGDDSWEIVQVTEAGWKIVPGYDCPVRFIRPKAMLPLPRPAPGGSVEELRPFLNVTDEGYMMCVGWLLAAMSDLTSFPLLAIGGEEGTGKSTAVTLLHSLIDPHQATKRRSPRNEEDLFIAATQAYVLPFDNLSSIPAWMSDALCVLATGGTYAARTLYANSEETLHSAKRPVLLNGIPDLMARPDLADRALTVTLQRIPAAQRRAEKALMNDFEVVRPRVLGALLDVLVGALKRLPTTQLDELPRMADFALLMTAAEPALPWEPGSFMRTYAAMQVRSASLILDDEPVADALRMFVDAQGQWSGTVKELLKGLNETVPPTPRPQVDWPATPKALGVSLRRLAGALGKAGYSVMHLGRSNKGERYALSKMQAHPAEASQDARETDGDLGVLGAHQDDAVEQTF